MFDVSPSRFVGRDVAPGAILESDRPGGCVLAVEALLPANLQGINALDLKRLAGFPGALAGFRKAQQIGRAKAHLACAPTVHVPERPRPRSRVRHLQIKASAVPI